jgi:hypothetical protein
MRLMLTYATYIGSFVQGDDLLHRAMAAAVLLSAAL